jgi:hypothetical protein
MDRETGTPGIGKGSYIRNGNAAARCIMVTLDTLAGFIAPRVHFHYDAFADVLYLRLAAELRTATYGDVTDGGDVLLRDERDGRPVGLTLISWWRRFGDGPLPDSLREFSARVQPFATQIAA